ncbi:MAG: hypothetical protein KA028_00565 [Candidatus Pacebacteria bacterium]|nr:hypothetical protein [Candidatus Paceibacterota bacterium]MBP9851696.1 hypothetical protein [Candidatus Paceibacterota bacterium]
MKIGLDFDGVIADCGKLKKLGAEQMFGVSIPEEKFKKEIVVGEGLLTLEQYRTLQKKIYGTRELGLQATAVPDAIDFIRKLQADGHDLFIITSRATDEELGIAKEWATINNLDIPFYGCKESKLPTCQELGIEIFVDDDLDKLISVAPAVKHLFLFSWGYNEDIDEHSTAIRIYDWPELYSKIKTLSN